jgi:hypothetical protein
MVWVYILLAVHTVFYGWVLVSVLRGKLDTATAFFVGAVWTTVTVLLPMFCTSGMLAHATLWPESAEELLGQLWTGTDDWWNVVLSALSTQGRYTVVVIVGLTFAWGGISVLSRR